MYNSMHQPIPATQIRTSRPLFDEHGRRPNSSHNGPPPPHRSSSTSSRLKFFFSDDDDDHKDANPSAASTTNTHSSRDRHRNHFQTPDDHHDFRHREVSAGRSNTEHRNRPFRTSFNTMDSAFYSHSSTPKSEWSPRSDRGPRRRPGPPHPRRTPPKRQRNNPTLPTNPSIHYGHDTDRSHLPPPTLDGPPNRSSRFALPPRPLIPGEQYKPPIPPSHRSELASTRVKSHNGTQHPEHARVKNNSEVKPQTKLETLQPVSMAQQTESLSTYLSSERKPDPLQHELTPICISIISSSSSSGSYSETDSLSSSSSDSESAHPSTAVKPTPSTSTSPIKGIQPPILVNPATRLNTITNDMSRIMVDIALLQQQLAALESEKIQILNVIESNFNAAIEASSPATTSAPPTHFASNHSVVSSKKSSGAVAPPPNLVSNNSAISSKKSSATMLTSPDQQQFPNPVSNALLNGAAIAPPTAISSRSYQQSNSSMNSPIYASINSPVVSVSSSSCSTPLLESLCVADHELLTRSGADQIEVSKQPLHIEKSVMIQNFTRRKPKTLTFHPDPSSNLVVAAHMDGGVRFVDMKCQMPVLRTNLNPDTGPEFDVRANITKFVSPNHMIVSHDPNTLSNQNDPIVLSNPMSLITVTQKHARGHPQVHVTTEIHKLNVSLYAEVTAIAPAPSLDNWTMATAGRNIDQDQRWRVHLWSLRPPTGRKYPTTLNSNVHFNVHEVVTQHTSRINSMLLVDSTSLVTSGFDGRVCGHDLSTNKLSWSFQVKKKRINHLLSSPYDPNLLFLSLADVHAQFGIVDRRIISSRPQVELAHQLQCIFGFDSKGSNLSQYLMPAVDPYSCRYFVVGSTDDLGSVVTFDIRYLQNLRMSGRPYGPTSSVPSGAVGHDKTRVEVCEFSPHLPVLATAALDHRIGIHSLVMPAL